MILEATIETDGRVVADARAAVGAAARRRRRSTRCVSGKYTPARLNGEPVSVLMTVTVNFTIGQ